jgi:non-ribosomal peptide synthetase component F/acetyltransferase-like isoleucine patch superfamily enzyme
MKATKNRSHAFATDATGRVHSLEKGGSSLRSVDPFEEEKKDNGSSCNHHQQRPPPPNHFDESFSSMNSEEVMNRIKQAVGQGVDYVVDDMSFSSFGERANASQRSLLGTENIVDELSETARFWYQLLLTEDDHGELPVLSLPRDPQTEIRNKRTSGVSDSNPSSQQLIRPPQPPPQITLDLPPFLANGIPATAKTLHTTPVTLYMCAYEILLKRWTGDDDLVLGMTIRPSEHSDRLHVEKPPPPTMKNVNFAPMKSPEKSGSSYSNLGDKSINTLPIRLEGANAGRTLAELVRARDIVWRNARSHLGSTDLSGYDSTAQEIESKMKLQGNTTIFQVLLDYMEQAPDARSAYTKKWVPLPCTEQHPLRVSVFEGKTSSKVILQYNRAIWTNYLANNFLQNYETLLRSMVEAAKTENEFSTTLCSTVKILSQEQLDFINRECYGPIEVWPEKPLMHQWFEQAADGNPNGIALKIMKQEMTYHEVENRANKLARYLVDDLGVETEDIVAILMPRGFNQIVALLAVLKAGAAYVPCDMTYPRSRIDDIMNDADSFVCLTVPEGMDTAGERGIDILERRELINAKDGSRLNTLVYLDNLAYILYTSGSTGKPKGVQIEHNTVANYGNIVKKRFGIKEHWRKRKVPDNVLMTARISWDASLESLMLAWTNQSTLCLIPSEFEDTLVQNIELIATEMKITRMSCAPGFSQWMDPSRLNHIQLLIFGGDVLPPSTAEAWQCGSVMALNSYGPTEVISVECDGFAVTCLGFFSHFHSLLSNPQATCCVTDNLGIENEYPNLASVPLGKPYENTVTLILDKNRQMCPPGVPGECYITGDCLARGYRNLAEVTDRVFVHNPFDDPHKKEGETRMYKTGDLITMLPDGQLNFVGRIQSDSSYIKLRGYRIELGEIMAALDDHPIVTASIAIPDMEHQKLLAFVTVNGGGRKPAVQILLDHCLKRLVDYMVPDRLMVLNSFPLDANGKIDRKKLIKHSRGSQHSRNSLVQAQSNTELKLTQIFAQSLGVASTQISVQDNFFDLGGHSLLAAGAVSSIRETFNTDEFGVRDFFSARTIKDMASVIDSHLNPKEKGRKISTANFIESRSLNMLHLPNKTRAPFKTNFVKFVGVMTVSLLIAGCFLPSVYLLQGLPWAESQENATNLILMVEAAFFSFVGCLFVVSLMTTRVLAFDIENSKTLGPGSFDFLRWYVADQLWRLLAKNILLPVFAGTLWMPRIYRLFGARIGRGVFIEDAFFRFPRLVSIGNFVVIQSDAILETVRVLPNGDRVFGKITLNDRVVVGCRSVVGMGSEVGQLSIVRSVSNVPRDASIPERSIVSGTTIEPQNDAHVEAEENVCSILISNMLWHICSPLLVHFSGLCELISLVFIAWVLLVHLPLYAALVFLVVLHPLYIAVIKIAVAIIAFLYRRVLCWGRMSPRETIIFSSAFYRYWAAAMAYKDLVSKIENTIVSRLVTMILGGDVDLHSLYTAEPSDPELCVMGRNVFVANGVQLRNLDFDPSGKVRFGRVVIRDDCMLMDRAVIAEGAVLGKGVTIGVLTPTYRKTLRASSLYVGNPPFEKISVSLSMKSKRKSVVHPSLSNDKVRQIDTSISHEMIEDAPERPTMKSKNSVETFESVTIPRAIFEYFMIGYASLLSLEAPVLGLIGIWFYAGAGEWTDDFWFKLAVFVGASPIVGILMIAWMMMAAVLVKTILVGDFSTFVEDDEFLPETHLKVFRWRLAYLLVCDAKKFLQWVDNYELTRSFWRIMGVKVGNGVMIHPEAYMYETDLLHLDDGAQVDEMATLFCHTFRTRHLELKPIYVGAGASIGINSVVLPGCQIGANVELLPLTQVFPTERIKAGVWHGNPAEPVHLGQHNA